MKPSCSVGVFAFNEEQNIEKCLDSIMANDGEGVHISEILVVASGCTDATCSLVRKYPPPVRLIEQSVRLGKSSAVNIFMGEASENIRVLVSGDLTVSPGSIEKLVKAVMQKGVGLAGARTVPERSGNFLVEGIVRFNWEMTHRLSLVDPRPGEMVAVRDMDVPIPEKLPVDEAFLESVSTAMGRRIVYVPDAVVYNRGPLSVRGYIQQSRRIARGHFQLRSEYGYTVSSLKPLKLMKAFPWGRLLSPVGALLIVYAVSVEILGRLLGFADYHLFRERTGLWPMTHKRRVSLFNGLRNTEESGKPS